MSIKLNYAFLSETVVQSDTKNLSIINIVENIHVPSTGAIIPQLVIMAQFVGGGIEKEYSLSVSIEDPKGTNILGEKQVMVVRFGPEKDRGNSIFRMPGLQFKDIGEYKIKFWNEEVLIDSISFDVKAI